MVGLDPDHHRQAQVCRPQHPHVRKQRVRQRSKHHKFTKQADSRGWTSTSMNIAAKTATEVGTILARTERRWSGAPSEPASSVLRQAIQHLRPSPGIDIPVAMERVRDFQQGSGSGGGVGRGWGGSGDHCQGSSGPSSGEDTGGWKGCGGGDGGWECGGSWKAGGGGGR